MVENFSSLQRNQATKKSPSLTGFTNQQHAVHLNTTAKHIWGRLPKENTFQNKDTPCYAVNFAADKMMFFKCCRGRRN